MVAFQYPCQVSLASLELGDSVPLSLLLLHHTTGRRGGVEACGSERGRTWGGQAMGGGWGARRGWGWAPEPRSPCGWPRGLFRREMPSFLGQFRDCEGTEPGGPLRGFPPGAKPPFPRAPAKAKRG